MRCVNFMRLLYQIRDSAHEFQINAFCASYFALRALLYGCSMSLPIIAIIGRPNVGKSTLFNRLIGERLAVTSPVPGTTRDRIYHEAELDGSRAILVDTGGMEFERKHDIEADIQTQAKIAVQDANIIFFVIDASEPLTSSDYDCADFLRKSKKPIILVAHKSDNKKNEEIIPTLYKLGLDDPIPVSAIHNFGIDELEQQTKKILKKLKWKTGKQRKDKNIRIAIIGKPNVGKSSLINALLGQNRLIVSEKPGTTIDVTDTPFHFNGQDFVLTDTAGIRRRGKIGQGIERYGVLRSLQAISRSEIACLLLDYGTGIANQDMHVSEYILEAGKGLIVAVNKSDLMENPSEDQKKFLDLLTYRMNYMPWAPVIFISALKRKNILKIFELAKNITEERNKKIPDAQFAVFVKTTIWTHPPAKSGRKVVITKGWQSNVDPPTFTFTTNAPDLIHFSYRRFLENEIRRKYGFYGTAIRLRFKKG